MKKRKNEFDEIFIEGVRCKSLETMKEALELGADVNIDIGDVFHPGWTALHYAAWLGLEEMANLLIKYGANIHQTDGFGCTAAWYISSVEQQDPFGVHQIITGAPLLLDEAELRPYHYELLASYIEALHEKTC